MASQAQSRASKRPRERVADRRLLTPDEIERLRSWGFSACRLGERGGALTVALLGTGGRRFEVAALRCQDVRLGPGGSEVYFPETKGGGPATVPISTETYTTLTGWVIQQGGDGRDPLIPTEQGEFMHVATLWRAFGEALRAAGVTRQLGVHATRHAAGFLLLRATGDLTKVKTFLRHKSLITTSSWYEHVHLPDLRAGLEKAGL